MSDILGGRSMLENLFLSLNSGSEMLEEENLCEIILRRDERESFRCNGLQIFIFEIVFDF